ncbi:thiol reductant ABC exporter subunit CydD [Salininema proteolyticum]|uniref:Thiol reductant ABC exporter subunit CydD n=1 Tax=Salininema proteolyticum TaxID=1607685 RepID=A0ABV8U0H4_9ACTN
MTATSTNSLEPPRTRGIDRRLFRYTRGTRRYIVLSAVLGAVTTACIIAGAWSIATLVSGAVAGELTLEGSMREMAVLAGAMALRAIAASVQDSAAQASASGVKRDLRSAALASLARQPEDGRHSGETANLLVRGIESLDSYFSRYIPQLVLAVLVPLSVIAVMATADVTSAVVVVLTLPLIPVFGILIGLYTSARAEKQWKVTALLARRFTDLVAGLPTLKAFGRAERQTEHLRASTVDYRKRTMSLLKVAFMSALALELAASISVAIVAVEIGVRLVHGDLSGMVGLQIALFVLILAPEAYLPLRQVGVHYHASAEGLAAADELFATIKEEDTGEPARAPAAVARSAPMIQVRRARFAYPGREPLPELSMTIPAGAITVLTAPSGAGKSTLFSALLGFRTPQSGSLLVGEQDLAEADLDQWRHRTAWMPQKPVLVDGTIADNVRLAVADEVPDSMVEEAVAAAQAPDPSRSVSASGSGVSAGEAARIGLARLFLRVKALNPPVLILDEPTAHLDRDTEARVLDGIRRHAEGRTVLIASHRPAVAAIADREVTW